MLFLLLSPRLIWYTEALHITKFYKLNKKKTKKKKTTTTTTTTIEIKNDSLAHDKMTFSEHTLKLPCAMRFIYLKNIHAGTFFRNRMSIPAEH